MRTDGCYKTYRKTRNTHFMLDNFIFENVVSYDNEENCSRAGRATDDKSPAHCMSDT
jgi:hypothetical protein